MILVLLTGGGMDQAIEILARKGTAKLIEFNPLRTYDVSLPSSAVFVISNSLAESNKAAGADYNTRVAECRMATKVMAKRTSNKKRFSLKSTRFEVFFPPVRDFFILFVKQLHM